MRRLRTAVIGAGYLGRFHARKLAAHPDTDLVAVVDVDAAAAGEIAGELHVEPLTDYRSLWDRADAVSVVVPTALHHQVASECLASGLHVLLEKPMAASVAEADELVRAAERHGRVLQIGHLERFNPAILALEGHLERPMFFESHRLAPFKPRGTDVSVVLDLMIHDIDIIQNLVNEEITHIDANGVSVLTPEIDIANARIRFAGGCVANVTASRVSAKSERKMRVFQHDTYISVDFQNQSLTMHSKAATGAADGMPAIDVEQHTLEPNDALYAEVDDFIHAISEGRPPRVTAEDGRRALDTAMRISAILAESAGEART